MKNDYAKLFTSFVIALGLTVILLSKGKSPEIIKGDGRINLLIGTWEGIWYVDEKFDHRGSLGQHNYKPARVQLIIHQYDKDNKNFGEIHIEGALSGRVKSIKFFNNNELKIEIIYSLYGYSSTYGHIKVTLNEDKLSGDFDEDVPAPIGFENWRGPIELEKSAETFI